MQGGAEPSVDPRGEGQMTARVAIVTELVGVGELVAAAARGREAEVHHLPGDSAPGRRDAHASTPRVSDVHHYPHAWRA